MQFVIEHTRTEAGWELSSAAPINSPGWGPFIRGWIQWMQNNGQDVVTIGDTMIQITTRQ
jgi:hypothetical protein